MSNLIISQLGTPWITQATWNGEHPRTTARRRLERERERAHRRNSRS